MIGTLIIVYSLTDNSSVYYNFAPHIAEQLIVDTMVSGLPVDLYKVSVFIIDERGLPFPRAAARPRAIKIDGNYLVHEIDCKLFFIC